MAVSMDMDIGELIKKLFSGKTSKKANTTGGVKSKANDDKNAKQRQIYIAAGLGSVLALGLLTYFVLLPNYSSLLEARAKALQVPELKSQIADLEIQLISEEKETKVSEENFKTLTNLFHTEQELEGLYRDISTMALLNRLTVTKIKKGAESAVKQEKTSDQPPSFDPAMDQNQPPMANNEGTNDPNAFVDPALADQETPTKATIYSIPLEVELTGRYLSYVNFRKGLSEISKLVNIDKETIVVSSDELKPGIVKISATLSTYRLPK